jgi:triacylglycerol lipase
MKKVLIGIIVLLFALPMVSMASSTTCATKYPIVLSHGMGANADVMGITNYWGSIPSTLQSNGANVYITDVDPMQSKAIKGAEWKTQVLSILAVSGAAKINVIGHSDGGLYTRYAISNLGMAPYVASYTSMSSPHRGSPVADVIMGFAADTGLTSAIAGTLNYVYSFMGVTGQDCATNGTQETTTWMINTFNPNTPDVAGVYYQSYGADCLTAIGGQVLSPLWAAMLVFGSGTNDGLVPVSSAKWGTYRGTLTGWFGVNHMSEVGLLEVELLGYDPPTEFVSVVADLKSKGY